MVSSARSGRQLKSLNRERVSNKLMLDDIRDSIFILDLNGRIVYVNDEACQSLGFSKDELIGKDVRTLDTPEYASMVSHKISKIHEKGYIIHNTMHRCKDGSIKVSEHLARLISIDGVEYVFGLAKDISDVSARIAAYVSAQEKEREWVTIEIHDRVLQSLTGLQHRMEAFKCEARSAEQSKVELGDISKQLSATIFEIRTLMKELYPDTLARYGLVGLIREELNRVGDEIGCDVEFKDKLKMRLPKYLETTLYRVYHEALLNVKKHSHATKIKVNLKTIDSQVILDVIDNGTGFNAKSVDIARPGGLESMRERTEIVGGLFTIKSEANRGTHVKALIPIVDDFQMERQALGSVN